jgi:pimeloyl-ACP methyl ester carboxylesterase
MDATVDLDGPVHYVDHGGDGPPLVLVHGLGGAAINWMDAAPGLRERTHPIAVDLAGFGRTPRAGRGADVDSNGRLLSRFIEHVVGEPVILAGNSQGGMMSILLAAGEPEKVSGLVLVDPALPRPRGARIEPLIVALFAAYVVPRLGEALVRHRVARLGARRVAEGTLRLCSAHPERLSRRLWEAHVAMAEERHASVPDGYDSYVTSARSLVRTLARRRWFEAALRRVQAPTLLLHGEKDRLVPVEAAREAAQVRPDWTLVTLPDVGHVPMMEAPELFVRTTLGWLGSNGLLDARAGARAS